MPEYTNAWHKHKIMTSLQLRQSLRYNRDIFFSNMNASSEGNANMQYS